MQKRINILYLDDEEQNLLSFSTLFRREYNIFTANTAQKAVDFLNTHDIQIILSDQKMPELSGVEFFENIRHEFPDAVRILITGYADMDAVIDAINRGQIYRYITKPWDNNELKICIDNAIEKHNREKELHQKNKELERVNSELERFVYSASHDMRAPLASIQGIVKVAKSEGISDEKTAEYFSMVEQSANRLNDFITNIIHYYQNTQTEEILSEVDFNNLVDELILQYRNHDNAQGIEIRKSIIQNGLFKSDSYRLKMILSNLLSNSLKFSDSKKNNKFVEIEILQNSEKAIIKVIDNGIGIAPEEIPKIFEMFYPSADKQSGSGVGLYIVKQAVDKMGGTILAKSEEGKETRFTVEIPNKDE